MSECPGRTCGVVSCRPVPVEKWVDCMISRVMYSSPPRQKIGNKKGKGR